MTSYLQAGWFTRGTGPKGLRTEVIDGAMDVAGNLVRAGIDGATVLRLALRARGLISIADPRMLGMPHFGDREREQLMNGLARHADAAPELFAFVADCIERIDNLTDMMAFYLHLTHVARMIELLSVAVRATSHIAIAAERPVKKSAPAKRKAQTTAKKSSSKSAAKKTAPKKSALKGAKKTAGKKAGVSKKAAPKEAQPQKTQAPKTRSKKTVAKSARRTSATAKKAVAKKPAGKVKLAKAGAKKASRRR